MQPANIISAMPFSFSHNNRNAILDFHEPDNNSHCDALRFNEDRPMHSFNIAMLYIHTTLRIRQLGLTIEKPTDFNFSQSRSNLMIIIASGEWARFKNSVLPPESEPSINTLFNIIAIMCKQSPCVIADLSRTTSAIDVMNGTTQRKTAN